MRIVRIDQERIGGPTGGPISISRANAHVVHMG